MSGDAGTIGKIARELLKLYGLQLVVVTSLAVAIGVGLLAGLSAPGGLADNTRHAEWNDLFGTSGQVIATLMVALLVEAHTPFTRIAGLAARLAAAVGGLLLGCAGFAAVVALSPSLPGWTYPPLLGLTLGGGAGGLTTVVMLGISVALGTLRRIDQASLTKLRELGDPSATEELLRRRGL